MNDEELSKYTKEQFIKRGIRPVNIKVRNFPGERIVIVDVVTQLTKAVQIGSELDYSIENGFITVRQVDAEQPPNREPVRSVRDPRVTKLIELLDARSRTSEAQPSLRYVEDVEGRLQVATAKRHHLIFGRRGVGKTALMLETRRLLEERGAKSVWVNVQTLRTLGSSRAFLTLASRICELPITNFEHRHAPPASVHSARRLQETIRRDIGRADADSHDFVVQVIPEIQYLLQLYCAETQTPIFIFLDDVHYLPYDDVPAFLDMVHAITRDVPVWIKIAGIKHQMKWFTSNPPTGLQTGHDAIEINLDITLQEPERAKQFLQNVLDGYIQECESGPRRAFLSRSAIDRLVLASGGVPRDFATLCASAIQSARRRPKARATGVQDVNEAAGHAAKIKVQELEDDAAAALGSARSVLAALNAVRQFLLTEKQITFLRIDFLDKESHGSKYALIQRLMDLRMLHLINASLSDGHHAGRRSEVYLLDLSQYTGARLKQKLRVLDLQGGHIVLKKTRSKEKALVADTARKLVSILRRGPAFELSTLESRD